MAFIPATQGRPREASNSPLLASRPIQSYGTQDSSSTARPNFTRAMTTLPSTTATLDPSETRPRLSRPLLNRAATTAAGLQSIANAPKPARPSLLRRLTSTADALLDLSNATHRNAPPAPSHWTDHMHRRALLETWDRVHEAAGSSDSKYPKSLVGQLVSVEKEMLVDFPELVEGERGLGREWTEFVLGVGLRFPWCTTEKMGKWEVVASVGKLGARGWGPW
ncbi:hypothetical protein LTR95_018161 [Oleoguttula sp. CCFEE 5521]